MRTAGLMTCSSFARMPHVALVTALHSLLFHSERGTNKERFSHTHLGRDHDHGRAGDMRLPGAKSWPSGNGQMVWLEAVPQIVKFTSPRLAALPTWLEVR